MVIFGMGSVGLAALMAAKSMEIDTIIAIDLVEQRLELARELGATHVLNPKTTSDVVEEIKRLTRNGADFALECTGVLTVLEQSIECLGCLGTAASIGVSKAGVKI